MPAPTATCGATFPHIRHKANIEQVPWDWCEGAGFGICLNADVHAIHLMPNGALCFGPKPPAEGYSSMQELAVNDEPGIDRTVAAIRDWWIARAEDEVNRVAPKAVEYGSTDLIEIGRDLSHLARQWEGKDEEAMAELGIYFYMVGKMARWRDAIQRGERVSDDTLHDIGVYVRMAQRVRDVGGWPFGPEPFMNNANGGI